MTLPTKLTAEAWKAWIDYRKSKRKPITLDGASKQLAFLSEQPDPNEVIRQSIRNEYQGLFELKGGGNGKSRGHSDSLAGRSEEAERRADLVFGKL